MKKFIISIFSLFLIIHSAEAQYETVIFDFAKSTFNETQPLPAESNMMFTGGTSPQINMIEVLIFKSAGKDEKDPLYVSTWIRPYGSNSEIFNLPVNYKLRGRSEYDIEIRYYRNLMNIEKKILMDDINALLSDYIDMAYDYKSKKISLSKQHNSVLRDLNSVVISGMELYRNRNDFNFEGFSDIVKMKLKRVEEVNLDKSGMTENSTDSKSVTRNKARQQQIDQLKSILKKEVKQYLNNDLLVMAEVKRMYDYPTEKTKNVISVNAGYAATSFNYKFDNLDSDGSPYVGLSFPFGNKAMKSSFLSNSSISLGVFLLNMETDAGETVTGPFIKRPFYAGLGYRVFKFIRLNAGAVLLETEKATGNDVSVRPFIGASIDFNFWMGLGDK